MLLLMEGLAADSVPLLGRHLSNQKYVSVFHKSHLCTIKQQSVFNRCEDTRTDGRWLVVITIIPGSRRVAAASNLWLFRMSTSSPTVQLVVPQSASSSSVGLLPCATRPANFLETNSYKTIVCLTIKLAPSLLPHMMLRISEVPIRLPYGDDDLFPPLLGIQNTGQLSPYAETEIANVGSGSYRITHFSTICRHE